MKKRKIRYDIHISNVPIQQLIQHDVMIGYHFTNSVPFCESMIVHFQNLLNQAEEYKHISLFRDYVDNPFELREYLIKSYKKAIKQFTINLINLTITQN